MSFNWRCGIFKSNLFSSNGYSLFFIFISEVMYSIGFAIIIKSIFGKHNQGNERKIARIFKAIQNVFLEKSSLNYIKHLKLIRVISIFFLILLTLS